MPRKAKVVMSAEAPRVLSGQATLEELERALKDNLEQRRTLELATRQIKNAIEETRDALKKKRSTVIWDIITGDRSDAGQALMAALIERVEDPEDRALFDLPPREQNLIGAPGPGAKAGDVAPEHSVDAAPGGTALDRSEGQDAGDATSSESSDPSDPKGGSDITGGGVDEVESPVDEHGMDSSAEADEDADEAVLSAPRSDRSAGILDQMPEDGLALRPDQSDDPIATGVALADGVEAPIDDKAEHASAAGLRSRSEAIDDASTSPAPDVDPFAPLPPPFIPRAFISTRETANDIKARGFKLHKENRGVWTVTATTEAEAALLAPLGLRSYDPGRA